MMVVFALVSAMTVAEAGYTEGLEALRGGDASQAVAEFQLALEDGALHPAVYHGLGNALYRLDRKPEAAAAWRRGLALAPRDGDIAANLDLVRKSFEDRIEPPATHRPAFFWQSFLAPVETAWVSALALSLALWLAVWGRIRALRREGSLGLGVRNTALIALAVGALLAVSTVDAVEQRRGAVVIADEVDVRSALGPSGMSLFVLHGGAEVAIEDSTATHRLLLLSDGRKGWVHADVLLSTDPAQPFGNAR